MLWPDIWLEHFWHESKMRRGRARLRNGYMDLKLLRSTTSGSIVRMLLRGYSFLNR